MQYPMPPFNGVIHAACRATAVTLMGHATQPTRLHNMVQGGIAVLTFGRLVMRGDFLPLLASLLGEGRSCKPVGLSWHPVPEYCTPKHSSVTHTHPHTHTHTHTQTDRHTHRETHTMIRE